MFPFHEFSSYHVKMGSHYVDATAVNGFVLPIDCHLLDTSYSTGNRVVPYVVDSIFIKLRITKKDYVNLEAPGRPAPAIGIALVDYPTVVAFQQGVFRSSLCKFTRWFPLDIERTKWSVWFYEDMLRSCKEFLLNVSCRCMARTNGRPARCLGCKQCHVLIFSSHSDILWDGEISVKAQFSFYNFEIPYTGNLYRLRDLSVDLLGRFVEFMNCSTETDWTFLFYLFKVTIQNSSLRLHIRRKVDLKKYPHNGIDLVYTDIDCVYEIDEKHPDYYAPIISPIEFEINNLAYPLLCLYFEAIEHMNFFVSRKKSGIIYYDIRYKSSSIFANTQHEVVDYLMEGLNYG